MIASSGVTGKIIRVDGRKMSSTLCRDGRTVPALSKERQLEVHMCRSLLSFDLPAYDEARISALWL